MATYAYATDPRTGKRVLVKRKTTVARPAAARPVARVVRAAPKPASRVVLRAAPKTVSKTPVRVGSSAPVFRATSEARPSSVSKTPGLLARLFGGTGVKSIDGGSAPVASRERMTLPALSSKLPVQPSLTTKLPSMSTELPFARVQAPQIDPSSIRRVMPTSSTSLLAVGAGLPVGAAAAQGAAGGGSTGGGGGGSTGGGGGGEAPGAAPRAPEQEKGYPGGDEPEEPTDELDIFSKASEEQPEGDVDIMQKGPEQPEPEDELDVTAKDDVDIESEKPEDEPAEAAEEEQPAYTVPSGMGADPQPRTVLVPVRRAPPAPAPVVPAAPQLSTGAKIGRAATIFGVGFLIGAVLFGE